MHCFNRGMYVFADVFVCVCVWVCVYVCPRVWVGVCVILFILFRGDYNMSGFQLVTDAVSHGKTECYHKNKSFKLIHIYLQLHYTFHRCRSLVAASYPCPLGFTGKCEEKKAETNYWVKESNAILGGIQ